MKVEGRWAALRVVAAAIFFLTPVGGVRAQQAEQAPPANTNAVAGDAPVAAETKPYEKVIPLPPAAPEPVDKPNHTNASVLEEVVVTSTKRKKNIRDIALSIDAFSGQSLHEIGANDLESITRFSPGVSVSTGLDPEAAQVIIRGVSTDTFFTFFTRTFGLFYEDVSLVNPSILGPQPNIDPFDMATVEILKGPQGTLFGGSALAGMIRFVPNLPDYTAASAKLGASIGTLAKSRGLSHRYDGMVNQPLGNNLAVRLVASRVDHPGYIKNLRSGQDDINSSDAYQLRGLVSWRATDDLEFRFSALRRRTHQDDGNFANNDQRPEHSQRYFPDVLDSTTNNLLLTTEWNLDFAHLVVVLSQLNKNYPQKLDYSQFIGTSQAGIGTFGDTTIRSKQPSAEVRLVSTGPSESNWWLLRDWSYVAGYFWVYSDQFLNLDIGTAQTGALVRLAGDVDAKENAVFFDFSRALTERWEIGIGGRLFRQSTKADIITNAIPLQGFANSNPALAPLIPVIGMLPGGGAIPVGEHAGKVAENVFNPKFTLLYRYSKKLSLFGSAVKGFRYAGANQNPTQDPNVPLFFKSDHIWNYELGARTRWLGGALQIDATIFDLEWKDLQIQQRDFTGAFAYTTNVGSARNYGAELSINTLLPAGFSVRVNGSYVHARSTTFFNDFQGPAPAGTELPGSSPLSGSALVLWRGGLGPAALSSTVSYTYQTRNYNNLPHTYRHPALGLLGASARVGMPNWLGRPVLSFTGSNLTNEFKPNVVFDTPNTGGILVIFNQPRTLTLGIEFSFGGGG